MRCVGGEDTERDLHVRGADEVRIEEPPRPELRDQPAHLGEAEEEIHLRDFRLELLLVALDEAPHRHDRAHVAVRLERARLEDRVDGFFLRRLDEAAGVDHDDLGPLDAGKDPSPVSDEGGHQPLGVHGVLVAAQGHEADPEAVRGTRRSEPALVGPDISGNVRAHRVPGNREDGKVSGAEPPRHLAITWTPGGGSKRKRAASSEGFSRMFERSRVRTDSDSSTITSLRMRKSEASIHTRARR